MKRIGQKRLELALLGLIAVVCTGLSILQYRWTGEMGRGERVRLRSGVTEQVGRLARAFDDELRQSCRALFPEATEIRDEGRLEAHRSLYEQWAASHERSIFARIAIAVPEQNRLKLYSVEGQGRMVPIEWPPGWQTLRDTMTARMQGTGPPPSVPPDSTLIEFPVFDNSRRRDDPRPELECMIFEVSDDHLRTKTLPPLVAEYLDSGNDAVYDLSVSWADSPRPSSSQRAPTIPASLPERI